MANPVAIAASGTSLAADGASTTTLRVSAETDGDVTVTASTGTFVDAPAPAAGAPASKTVRTARGDANVTFRAGLDIGIAVITASSGGFSAWTNLMLTPSLPTQISLTPNRTSVTGDGASFVEIQADVVAPQPALVSHGTVLRFGVCCTTRDSLIDCPPGASPLVIPSLARVNDGLQVTVRAVAASTTATITAFVLARLDDSSITGSLCATQLPFELRSSVLAITVNAS